MKLNRTDNLVEKIYKITNIVNQEMKVARDYGVGFPLYHSEVQMLDVIDNHEGANASELAKTLGVTCGAIGQVTKKLMNKGLIESYQLSDNKKEVYFRLTDLGRKASIGHQKHHEKLNAGVYDYICKLEESELQKFSELLDAAINGMQSD
jgi:DNA-binding MarR family transcriptional regulator